jgi:hypothetical protein
VNERQKRAATALSLFLVGLAVAFLVWLAVEVAFGHPRGDAQPARLFMLLIARWDALALVFKAVPMIASIGLARVGAYPMKDGLFYAIVLFTVLGGVSVVYLWVELSSVSTAKSFWAYSPTDRLQDFEAFLAAFQKGLGAFGTWFVAVLLIELGVKQQGPA